MDALNDAHRWAFVENKNKTNEEKKKNKNEKRRENLNERTAESSGVKQWWEKKSKWVTCIWFVRNFVDDPVNNFMQTSTLTK